METVKVIPVTTAQRSDALWRDYERRPRRFRLTEGHLRYIQRLDAARADGAAQGAAPAAGDGASGAGRRAS